MTNPPPEADDWQRNFEGKLAEIEARNERMSQEMDRIQITERSSDGQISVTVNSQGSLTDLKLGDALRQRNGSAVAAEILRLVATAQSKIADKVQETMQPYIGGTEALDHVLGKVRAATPPAPPEEYIPQRKQAQPHFDDDEDFGSGSFLR